MFIQYFLTKLAKEYKKSIVEFYNPEPEGLKRKVTRKKTQKQEVSYEDENRPKRDKESMNEIEVGLHSALIEAFALINRFFNKDFDSGIRIMQKLLPPKEDISRNDFLAYNMASKISRFGRSPAQIFQILDEDGGGTLDYEEFKDGLHKKLGLMFS